MAALTLEQLRARSRAKFPVTVVRDEDYTTMTPTQIAAEWSAYSGGTDGVYLKDTDDTWYAMDPDLPKANDRGLLVFGGGKQYAQRCDFADVTVGQAPPASWSNNYYFSMTAAVTAKDSFNGLPYVEVSVSGTSTAAGFALLPAPGGEAIAYTETANGDVVLVRSMVSAISAPAQVSAVTNKLLRANTNPLQENIGTFDKASSAFQTVTAVLTDDGTNFSYTCMAVRFAHTNGVAYDTAAVVKMFPPLFTINTAFPDHFHCINTSTSSAATIVPEIMQRPMVLDEPWWAVIECDLPVRNVTGNHYIHEIAIDDNNRVNIIFSGAEVSAFLVVGGSNVAVVSFGNASPGEHAKVSFAATAQTMRGSLNGDAVVGAAAPRFSTTVSQSLGHGTFGSAHGFATFQNHSIGTGLVTDAQLIEWSTAA